MSSADVEAQIDLLAAAGWGVDLDRVPRGSTRMPISADERERGAGAKWACSLTRESERFPTGFGETASEAVQEAAKLAQGGAARQAAGRQ